MPLSLHDQRFVFDVLPVEVLYSIFDYLWTHDILYSFYNISVYLDSIISNYSNYHVNFQSILKRHFDRICRHIRPDQITSLVLSDSDDTPGQSHAFLSLFPIHQFTRLRALTLVEIDNASQPLFSNLCQVRSLISFETDTMSHLRFLEAVPQLKRLVVNKYSEDYYDHESFLSSITFSHIRTLTLPYCSYSQLRQILSRALKLTSLTISLSISDCSGIDYFAEQRQDVPLGLTHLNLSIHTFSKYREMRCFRKDRKKMISFIFLLLLEQYPVFYLNDFLHVCLVCENSNSSFPLVEVRIFSMAINGKYLS